MLRLFLQLILRGIRSIGHSPNHDKRDVVAMAPRGAAHTCSFGFDNLHLPVSGPEIESVRC